MRIGHAQRPGYARVACSRRVTNTPKVYMPLRRCPEAEAAAAMSCVPTCWSVTSTGALRRYFFKTSTSCERACRRGHPAKRASRLTRMFACACAFVRLRTCVGLFLCGCGGRDKKVLCHQLACLLPPSSAYRTTLYTSYETRPKMEQGVAGRRDLCKEACKADVHCAAAWHDTIEPQPGAWQSTCHLFSYGGVLTYGTTGDGNCDDIHDTCIIKAGSGCTGRPALKPVGALHRAGRAYGSVLLC